MEILLIVVVIAVIIGVLGFGGILKGIGTVAKLAIGVALIVVVAVILMSVLGTGVST